ncbi:MAG TPA: flavodoxin family protein [Dehalococcoidia bacterium]|nr:flavodoxin family protein [Dehalococcoidia bacterium]
MSKALVVYHSATGHTKKMAIAIGEGIKNAGLDVEVKSVDNTSLDDLIAADAIILGSPTYFGTVSNKMKAFIDKSTKIWPNQPGELKDKIGAAFTSCADVAGGSQMTLLSLIQAMLWHGMVIVGHQLGFSGAVSIEAPDKDCIAECRQFGERIAIFVKH